MTNSYSTKRGLHLSVDTDYLDWIKKEASRTKNTRSGVVENAIDFYIKHKETPERLRKAKTMLKEIIIDEVKKEIIRQKFADMMD